MGGRRRDAADCDAVLRRAALPGNWKFIGRRWMNAGESVSPAGNLNGDASAAARILEPRDGTVYKPPWLTNRLLRE